MQTADFDYVLPPDLIAQYPVPRGESRLMVVGGGKGIAHSRICELPALLHPGDLLVVNNTRVIPARLLARKRESGGRVELLLIEKVDDRLWVALVRPSKRIRPGTELALDEALSASVLEKLGSGRHLLRFDQRVEPHLSSLGHIPLPPYIQRPDDARDRETYQTVFAKEPGAIAAPTAGLHFSSELIAELSSLGVEVVELTLHVGPGTFEPVKADVVEEHRMEAERYDIPSATVAAIARTKKNGGRIVAVGTTVVRTLEAAAEDTRALPAAGPGRTDIFIYPGFPFRVVDALLTNFHLPRSTLLMLVCAFAGQERILAAYREAVASGYRFYSYGDAMLVEAERR